MIVAKRSSGARQSQAKSAKSLVKSGEAGREEKRKRRAYNSLLDVSWRVGLVFLDALKDSIFAFVICLAIMRFTLSEYGGSNRGGERKKRIFMVMLMQNLKVDTLFCFCKMISFTGRVAVNDEYWMYII